MPPRIRASRPYTVPELLERAQIEASKPQPSDLSLQDLVRTAQQDFHDARSLGAPFLDASGTEVIVTTQIGKDLERSFLAFWRAAGLIFDKIPAHTDYGSEVLSFDEKTSLTENGHDALQEIGRLKPVITKIYERYARGEADPEAVPVYPDTSTRRQRRKDLSEREEEARMAETAREWRDAWDAYSARVTMTTTPSSPPHQLLPDVDTIDSPSDAVTRSDSLQTVVADSPAIRDRVSRPYSSSAASKPSSSSPRMLTSGESSPSAHLRNFMSLWEDRGSLTSQDSISEQDSRHEDFEAQMALCLKNILDSRETRHAALRLQGENAQAFLDAVQHVLHCGSLPNATSANTARKLMQRISEAQDQLPTSLFINGVHDPDEHPTFGGGFGDVYCAFYDGKRVALKRIRTFTAELRNPKRMKFCREALVWQGLRHPNILPFLGIDRHSFPSSFCMVSPWMKHGTILKFLADRGRTDIHRLTLEIAQGLHYLHSRNIVHGDLKGGNILVTDDGHACLSDFGLATTIQDGDPQITSTAIASGSNHAGSLRWTAPELLVPEQFGCERFLKTRATDVYAFACVCIELETGKVPFAEVTEIQAMFNILRGIRPDQPETMTDTMYDLVTEAWAENFRDRPNTRTIIRLLEEE
ncbi:kinase-like protein [Favolaschia claudopus]|uniref:Kinase-like protein n=1 Tax=Favolaschia claudopus TaxID=2862362 RepID=A0AAV9Z2X9_9AGAR